MIEFLKIMPPIMLLYMAAFLLYLFTVRKLTPFSFVLVGVMFLEVLHQGIAMYLRSFFSDDSESVQGLVFHAWYLSFAFTDFMFFGLTFLLSRWLHLSLDLTSKAVSYLYLLMGMIQLICYLDELYFLTNKMAFVYISGIPLINYTISLLLFGHVLKSLITKKTIQHCFA